MFEHVLDAGERRRASRKVASVALALAFHGGALAAVLAASMVAVGAVGTPDLLIALVSLETAPPEVPSAAAAPRKAAASPTPVVKPAPPGEPTQPKEIRPITDADKLPSVGPDGLDQGSDSGQEGGVEGGDPDGVPGGLKGIFPSVGGWKPVLPGGGGGAGDPLVVSGDITEPVVVRKVEPVYPEAARRGRIQGVVVFRAVINESGDVESIETLRGAPFLTEAALDAVRQWKYRPATLDGRAVRVYFTVTVTFRLERTPRGGVSGFLRPPPRV